MGNYMSCLYEKSYNDSFQCIREDVNSKNSFKGASYFIKKDSEIKEIKAIPKNLIFYTIYGHAMLSPHNLAFLHNTYGLEYPNLPENSQLIVSLKTGDGIIEYTKDTGKQREDIYVSDYYLRAKMPESILLTNSENDDDIKKLIEARPYNLTTLEDIKKLKKILDKGFANVFYVPLSLSLPIVLNNQEYFPHIYYISKPYTISTPYVFEIYYGTHDIIKVPIKSYTEDLCFLSIKEIVEFSTMEPHALGLDPRFELKKDNLKGLKIQVKYDEFEFRIYNSIIELAKVISTLMFSPDDIGTYQVAIKNKKPILIDIASGINLPTNPKGLNKITLDAIVGIAESIYHSPLLNHCIIKDNYVICDEKITKSDLPEKLIRNLNLDEILYKYDNTSNKKIDELFKHAKIKDTKLKDIIIQHKKDEFEENKEILSKELELYLRDHNN